MKESEITKRIEENREEYKKLTDLLKTTKEIKDNLFFLSIVDKFFKCVEQDSIAFISIKDRIGYKDDLIFYEIEIDKGRIRFSEQYLSDLNMSKKFFNSHFKEIDKLEYLNCISELNTFIVKATENIRKPIQDRDYEGIIKIK